MIQQITKLKNFGIFSDFKCTSASVREFKRYNLIYGWNGSGKSTLTKLFACIEKNKTNNDFPNNEFSISIKDQQPLTAANIETNQVNIRVFNQDFISDNIQWNNEKSAKSILILSEEKIEEKKRFEDLKAQLFVNRNNLGLKEKEEENNRASIEAYMSATAKTIKEAFKIIDTSDTYYFNYNRTKLQTFIDSPNTKFDQSTLLTKEQLNALTNSIKPNSKPVLDFELNPLNIELLKSAEDKIKSLIETNIINDSIERLKANPDIQDWVKRGIEIHEYHNSNSCEYCGQNISKDRSENLKSHFNDEFLKFTESLSKAIQWIIENKISSILLPDSGDFYDEFQSEFAKLRTNFHKTIEELNSHMDMWVLNIEEKRKDPFKDLKWSKLGIIKIVKAVNEIAASINSLKESHNRKTKNFDTELRSQKTKLETHYTTDALNDKKFVDLTKSKTRLIKDIESLRNKIKIAAKEAEDLEKLLTDEVKGASQFNDLLKSFLGRDDISLKFMEKERGYKIIRKGSLVGAKNLSEGEKTAIAFIYFIIKLKENGNNISDTIVVVDDPISSLDSNHLIHSYSFLKNQCSGAKQLFVLTHNFHFFKLIRDWFYYINNANGDKNYYTISSTIKDGIRTSSIVNANDFLLKYNSEYHYLFSKLIEFDKKADLNSDDMYLVANLSRRFIESLITFKYPKKTRDIWEKFQKVNFEEVEKTKVYKFINLYSHNDKIESHETFGDNLFAEGKTLLRSTLDFIKAIDEPHYLELEEISKN